MELPGKDLQETNSWNLSVSFPGYLLYLWEFSILVLLQQNGPCSGRKFWFQPVKNLVRLFKHIWTLKLSPCDRSIFWGGSWWDPVFLGGYFLYFKQWSESCFCFHLVIQLMINCWFGLVVWIPGIPLWKGLLLRGTPRIPNKQPKPTINH